MCPRPCGPAGYPACRSRTRPGRSARRGRGAAGGAPSGKSAPRARRAPAWPSTCTRRSGSTASSTGACAARRSSRDGRPSPWPSAPTCSATFSTGVRASSAGRRQGRPASNAGGSRRCATRTPGRCPGGRRARAVNLRRFARAGRSGGFPARAARGFLDHGGILGTVLRPIRPVRSRAASLADEYCTLPKTAKDTHRIMPDLAARL